MDGYIQIYNGSIENDNIIFEDHNLVVDGASEHIASMFTYLPSPSSISASIARANSVAGITAISLGSAQGSKSYNSLGLSGIKSLAAIPPTPPDTTLQPPLYEYGTSGPGRLGQFLNYIDFSGHYPTLTPAQIKSHGCYIPSGGIMAASGNLHTFSWLSVKTHDGRGIALKSDGTLHGWGRYQAYPQEYILTDIPTGTNFSSVELGVNHAIALTRAGTITSWGDDSQKVISNTPSGNIFTQVAAGDQYSLALDSSGYIHAWGDYIYSDETLSNNLGNTPTASGFVYIAAGGSHNLAIDSSGYITAWGVDSYGSVSSTPDTSGWTKVAAGTEHSLALSATDGSGYITAWGNPSSINSTPSATTNAFTDIAAGTYHNLALSGEFGLSAWGVDSIYSHVTNKPIAHGITSIAAGSDFNLTLSGEYLVSGWGNDAYGGISNIPANGYGTTTLLYTGTLNDTSSINSEGYILESRVARDTQILADSSAGFVVSGIGSVSSTREIKYILTLNRDEWYFLNKYYGGIGSIGLWTLDVDETLKKYPEGTTMDNIDLYNLADTSRNPVFKLFSKKVFLPGGLQLIKEDKDSFLTIIWSIKF